MEKKGKVLFVRTPCGDLNPNTYNNQQIGMGKAFCRMGYDFDFITFKKHDQKEWTFFEYNGCKARWIEKPRKRVFRWGINKSIVNKEFLSQYDFVLSQEYYQIMTYYLSKESDNIVMYSGPYTNLFYTSIGSKLYDWFLTKRINKNIKYKLTKSVLAQRFLEKKGYDNVTTVGVGLDFERFENEKEMAPETKPIVDFMKEHKCILYVGSLWSVKNYPFLLEVFQKVKERDPEIKMVTIGRSIASPLAKLFGKSNDSYAKDVEAKVPKEVMENIYHVEKIPNPQLKYIYPLAKVFLLPSHFEIFGMVLLEAMYFGIPVVTRLNGGSSSMIEGRDSGIIVDEYNADKWADAIFKYLNNPEYAKTVSENAQRVVREEFTWDAIAKKMIKTIYLNQQ